MNVGIVGCGLIGHKRAKALNGHTLIACSDVVPDRAQSLARECSGAQAVPDWRQLVARRDLDLVVVATTHDALAEIALAAVTAGKHVLVEKPAARRAAELEPVVRAAERAGVLVHVGFNHRYHYAFRKARELVDSGAIGPLLYVRGRYGHGGRIGYEKEWRFERAVSGGGQLIDQGMHLIDLSRWFLGNFRDVTGSTNTYYWDMSVEDNAFMILKTAANQTAFLHTSCTEWKNLFSFELFGREGKLQVDGLGGSYGVERLTYYRMLPQMGPPETTSWEYPFADNSWELELAEFMDDIRLKRQPAASLRDAQAALEIAETIYRQARSHS